jgi:hypothetical protein
VQHVAAVRTNLHQVDVGYTKRSMKGETVDFGYTKRNMKGERESVCGYLIHKEKYEGRERV